MNAQQLYSIFRDLQQARQSHNFLPYWQELNEEQRSHWERFAAALRKQYPAS
jgi:predicted RecB family nuclease